MHELGIAMEIYRISRDAVAGHGAGRLESVRVAVGELRAVDPELIKFAWAATVAGGPDAGSELIVDWHPAVQRCETCDADKSRDTAGWLPLCPDCSSPLSVEGGLELDVLQVSYLRKEEERAVGGGAG